MRDLRVDGPTSDRSAFRYETVGCTAQAGSSAIVGARPTSGDADSGSGEGVATTRGVESGNTAELAVRVGTVRICCSRPIAAGERIADGAAEASRYDKTVGRVESNDRGRARGDRVGRTASAFRHVRPAARVAVRI